MRHRLAHDMREAYLSPLLLFYLWRVAYKLCYVPLQIARRQWRLSDTRVREIRRRERTF